MSSFGHQDHLNGVGHVNPAFKPDEKVIPLNFTPGDSEGFVSVSELKQMHVSKETDVLVYAQSACMFPSLEVTGSNPFRSEVLLQSPEPFLRKLVGNSIRSSQEVVIKRNKLDRICNYDY